MLQDLLKQITGSSGASASDTGGLLKGLGEGIGKTAEKIPGGLAGGAAAGGLVAVLMGSKKARKLAGKAAGYGGAAVLGGLAYSAFRNWKENNGTIVDDNTAAGNHSRELIAPPELQNPITELTLVKAMIAAAKADGHLDQEEQRRIHEAVGQMSLSTEAKAAVFDLLQRDIDIRELLEASASLEQRSEVYLASCLVIDIDHPEERQHLDKLAVAFELPEGLPAQLEQEARGVLN